MLSVNYISIKLEIKKKNVALLSEIGVEIIFWEWEGGTKDEESEKDWVQLRGRKEPCNSTRHP